MSCAFYESPLGWIKIVDKDDKIYSVAFIHPHDYAIQENQQKLPLQIQKISHGCLGDCINQLQEFFTHKRQSFDLPLSLSGTDFQIKVWQTLQKIPYKQTLTYQEVAQKSGFPNAHRAAANAIAANPISIIIPCHRVILASGRIGGYAWGEDKKQWLLRHEMRGRGDSV